MEFSRNAVETTQKRSGVGRCQQFFWLGVFFDTAGVVVLFTGVFADLLFYDFLLYLGSIIIFFSLLWWVFWYTGNLEMPAEQNLVFGRPFQMHSFTLIEALRHSVSHRFSLSLSTVSHTFMRIRKRRRRRAVLSTPPLSMTVTGQLEKQPETEEKKKDVSESVEISDFRGFGGKNLGPESEAVRSSHVVHSPGFDADLPWFLKLPPPQSVLPVFTKSPLEQSPTTLSSPKEFLAPVALVSKSHPVSLASTTQSPGPLASKSQPAVHLASTTQSPGPLASKSQPAVHLASTTQPPVPLALKSQPAVPLASTTQSPVLLASKSQPVVPLASTTQSPGPLASKSQPAVHLASTTQSPGPLALKSQPAVPLALTTQPPVPLASKSQPAVHLASTIQCPGPLASKSQPAVHLASTTQSPGLLASKSQPVVPLASTTQSPGPLASKSQPAVHLASTTQSPGPLASKSQPVVPLALTTQPPVLLASKSQPVVNLASTTQPPVPLVSKSQPAIPMASQSQLQVTPASQSQLQNLVQAPTQTVQASQTQAVATQVSLMQPQCDLSSLTVLDTQVSQSFQDSQTLSLIQKTSQTRLLVQESSLSQSWNVQEFHKPVAQVSETRSLPPQELPDTPCPTSKTAATVTQTQQSVPTKSAPASAAEEKSSPL